MREPIVEFFVAQMGLRYARSTHSKQATCCLQLNAVFFREEFDMKRGRLNLPS
jgi:hypothetical protein